MIIQLQEQRNATVGNIQQPIKIVARRYGEARLKRVAKTDMVLQELL